MRIIKICGEKLPYLLYIYVNGEKRQPKELKNKTIDAFSEEQAVLFFRKQYLFLEDYVEMGYILKAVPDYNKIEERKRYKEVSNKLKKEKEQKAWWNND